MVIRAILKPEIKKPFTNQVTDEFSFGNDLSEKLKTLKAVEKAAVQWGDLKSQNKRTSSRDFLGKRASHPYRSNIP